MSSLSKWNQFLNEFIFFLFNPSLFQIAFYKVSFILLISK